MDSKKGDLLNYRFHQLLLVVVSMAYACVGLLAASAAWGSVDSFPDDQQVNEQTWALQLGYFANIQNALNLKQQLNESGFDVQVVSTGEPGRQRYVVIGGWADDPEEFDSLSNEFEDAMGERGVAVQNPYLDNQLEVAQEPDSDPFEQPRVRYLLAQAGKAQSMGGESVGSAATSGYDPGIFRTPQEEIDSIPGFTAAGMQIIPTLGLSIGYDDNITRSPILEQESFFYIISPAVRVEVPSDHSILAVTAAVDIIRYTDSEIDNRTPWFVRADWAWDPSTRQDFNLFAEYAEGSDQRGTGRRQGLEGLLPIPLDDWKRFDYGGIWRYGAIGARGSLELRAGGVSRDYTNNREQTYKLDRDWWYGGGTFYWRVAPKTSLLADLQYTNIEYAFSDSSDSEETSWMLGLTWEATARTSGRISYGDQKKKFDDPGREDYSGPIWVVGVDWRPRTYSLLSLTGSRRTQEPDGNANFVVRQDISLAWTHDWATRFGTIVDVGYGTDDYRPSPRKDDIWYWSVGARYMFNPHFRLGGSIQGFDRNSDEREFEYNRLVYMLTLEVSF